MIRSCILVFARVVATSSVRICGGCCRRDDVTLVPVDPTSRVGREPSLRLDGRYVRGWKSLPIETMGFTCCVTLAGIVANPSSFFHWQRGGTAWDVVHTQHTHTNTVERGANEGNPHDRHVFLPFSFSFRSMDRWIEVSFVFFFLKYRFRFLSTEDGDGKGHPW